MISGNRKFGESIIDKAADILKRHKGTQSKLYNHCTRRYFMMHKHPNVLSRMCTVFQYDKTYSDTRISQILDDENINNDTMLAGIRNLGNCNLPISLKKPSHEIILSSRRTECHIVKFKTHPTGIYRECIYCVISLPFCQSHSQLFYYFNQNFHWD